MLIEVIMARDFNKNEKPNSKSLKDHSMPPLPFAHHIKEGKTVKNEKREGSDISFEESLKMIENMRKIHDDIEKKIHEVLEKTGWTPSYLKSFLDNPNNFDQDQWERVQKKQKGLMDSIKTPKELKQEEEMAKNKKGFPVHGKISQDTVKAKERRSKSAAARRKWLPMR